MALGMLLGVLVGFGLAAVPLTAALIGWLAETAGQMTIDVAPQVAQVLLSYSPDAFLVPDGLIGSLLAVVIAGVIVGACRRGSLPVRMAGAALAGLIVVACAASAPAMLAGMAAPSLLAVGLTGASIIGALAVVWEGLGMRKAGKGTRSGTVSE